MKAICLYVIAAMGLIGAVISLPKDAASQGMTFNKASLTLLTRTGRHVIKVDVATTFSQAEFGMRYRTDFPLDVGFLILLSQAAPGPISVTTTGVSLPLDLLFIASDGTVMEVHASIPMESKTPIVSNSPVAAALELRAGTIAEYGIIAGDKVVGAGLGAK